MRGSYLLEMHNLLGILVDHVGDGDCRYNLEKVWSNALKQASETFCFDGLLSNINDASVCGRMKNSSLSLKACAEKINRIDKSCTKSTLSPSVRLP